MSAPTMKPGNGMGDSAATCDVTVFIPTYNGDRYLQQIIAAVMSQKTDFSYELLIIDSGSTDDSLKIARRAADKHDNVRLHEIPNSEYGHGKTRNLAAQMARGDIVVYLSHDATPADNRWLYEIVQPFKLHEKIVGVMGKQIPRHHCIPMLKSEINGVFGNFGPSFGTSIFYKDTFIEDQGTYDAVSFYSDANSAARKEYLLGKFPYQDVAYAEDQLFGRDIINAGYYKAYAPRAAVVHSNDLKLSEYKHRMFDETMGLRKIGLPSHVPSKKAVLKMTVRGIVRDTRNILRDPSYSAKRKLYWLVVNPLFHIEKWKGVRLAGLANIDDADVMSRYSLEKAKKTT